MAPNIALKILHSLFRLKRRFSQALLRKTVSYKHLAEGILSQLIKTLKKYLNITWLAYGWKDS